MRAICGDNRFEVIARAKADLLKSTNINGSKEEMAVLDNFLFRCWQMGWLRKYEDEAMNTTTILYGYQGYWEESKNGDLTYHEYGKDNNAKHSPAEHPQEPADMGASQSSKRTRQIQRANQRGK